MDNVFKDDQAAVGAVFLRSGKQLWRQIGEILRADEKKS